MTTKTLILDSKNRVSLSKLLKFKETKSLQAQVDQNGDIILRPMASIPANELWLYENKKSLKSVKKGLSQKGDVSRGSFADNAKK